MLIDEAKIHIQAGRGGNGAVTFRREKYVDKGGPDGGDGGKGGDVTFIASNSENTLFEFYRLKAFKAEDGANGAKAKMFGRSGEDLILKVPTGTQFFDGKTLVADLQKEGETFMAAKGGKGGLGNVHFASSTHQVPYESKPAEEGEEKDLTLELKLIADVGFIGLPNAGKSTLISAISNARPKIADYPFTTVEPNLGVVKYSDKTFVVCDIPGLIEGASSGKGLGFKFLKHIARTKILVHLISSQSEDFEKDYQTIRAELEKFDPEIAKKKEIKVISKTDLYENIDTGKFKYDLAISAATGKNLDELKQKILETL